MSGCIQLLKTEVLQYTVMTRAIENSPKDYLILCTRQTHAAWCDSIEISYLNKALRFRSFPGSRDTRTTIPLFHTQPYSDVHVMWWWWAVDRWPWRVWDVACQPIKFYSRLISSATVALYWMCHSFAYLCERTTHHANSLFVNIIHRFRWLRCAVWFDIVA